MKYVELQKIKFQDLKEFELEYQKRLEGYGTIHTPLAIHPFGKETRITSKRYPLFVVNNLDLMMLQERIIEKATEITELLNNLPDVAKESFVRSVLINEIQSTNEIEGVHSSKKEIKRALQEMNENKTKKTRFAGIAKLYYYLVTNNGRGFNKITEIKEIRQIYDDLVSDEIAEGNHLDGELFRKGSVEIMQGDRVIHRGNPDETSITSDLKEYIDFINNLDIPYLIRVMLGHYFFEYVHPFYDGNGRTGRYITCRYLTEKLDILTALSFSHVINNQKNKYYNAFKITSAEYNMGEGTMFVYEMLRIVFEGQEKLIHNLRESESVMEKAYSYTETVLAECDDNVKNIFFLLCQSTLFKSDLSDEDIAKMIGSHRATTNRKLKILEQKDLIHKIKKRPSMHVLTARAIQDINNK